MVCMVAYIYANVNMSTIYDDDDMLVSATNYHVKGSSAHFFPFITFTTSRSLIHSLASGWLSFYFSKKEKNQRKFSQITTMCSACKNNALYALRYTHTHKPGSLLVYVNLRDFQHWHEIHLGLFGRAKNMDYFRKYIYVIISVKVFHLFKNRANC